MTTPRRERRRFQFSLRSLLVFVLVVSIGMSWFAVKLERARRQREAVRVIEKWGGGVGYDYGIDNPFAEPSIPDWVRTLLGDDFFFDAIEVRCGVDFGDEEASHLEVLTTLTRLDLGGTQVTDIGLKHLEGLTRLESLNLTGTQVTDAGLQHLEGASNLKGLYLYGTQVTPEGVKKLQEALPDCDIIY